MVLCQHDVTKVLCSNLIQHMHVDRSKRTRKAVEYTFKAYNEMMDVAIRQGRSEKDKHQELRSKPKRRGELSTMELELEAIRRGNRRGRSAAATM